MKIKIRKEHVFPDLYRNKWFQGRFDKKEELGSEEKEFCDDPSMMCTTVCKVGDNVFRGIYFPFLQGVEES